MNRRKFVGLAAASILTEGLPSLRGQAAPLPPVNPMELGLLIVPFGSPEERIRRVRDLGFTNCFLSLDSYIGGFTPAVVSQYRDLLAKYSITVTTVEVVGPGVREWNFTRGPSTIGLVPPSSRAARIDALRQAADFAKQLGIAQVQTHCGFIPEDPADPLYAGTVEAIRTVASHCKANGQYFLMETGQETPTTMSRMIRDVAMPNLAVGYSGPACAQHPCKGWPLADRSERAGARGADRQRAGRFQAGFHQAAPARLHWRHYD
jgi:L-ribulose-5-phosphate 3-epimerase